MEEQAQLMDTVQSLGFDLTPEALQALNTLPVQYIAEFLASLTKKVNMGTIRNPSSYICATISKGYTPNEQYHAQKGDAKGWGKGDKGGGGYQGYASSYYTAGGTDEMGAALLRVQQAGVVLDDTAQGALTQIDPKHATEILEHVAEKAGELRDPSNYITATISRGYQPRGEKGDGKGYDGKGHNGKGYDGKGYGGKAYADASYGMDGYGGKGGGGAKGFGKPKHLPQDMTPLESKVLEVNMEGLWGEQQFDLVTYLTLRCLDQFQACDLLESFASKARAMKGKGKGISNINNYMQAAVSKIMRGEGPPGSGGDAGGGAWPAAVDGQPPAKRSRWE